jgi:type VI secretion system protein ImpL
MRKPFAFPTTAAVIAAIAALALILGLLLLGPRFGVPLSTARWAAVVVLGIFVLVFIVLAAVRRVRSARRARQDGGAPDAARATSPGSYDPAAAGERLDRMIQWLKKTKLAEKGRDPVYELPWYLLIGLQASGKSTLVVQSGFSFSYTEPKKPLGKPIVGPTEGCDLWVANEAVFIDPSGRYFVDDSTKDVWHATLDQIKQRRKAKPIDGIVLVIDTDSLLSQGHDALRLQAERARSFLDMAGKVFGMVLPVYLLFSKADRIEGFREFFGELANGGNIPFGATLRQEQFQNPHPEEEFRALFDEIYHALLARRTSIVADSSGRVQEKAFSFPAQFPLMREQLSEFIEVLFQLNQFREQPLLRGFYFTSALQAGHCRSLVAELIASKAGLPKAVDDAPVQETKSFFVNALFTHVIIPDRGLAGLSRAVRRRRMHMRMAVLGFAGIVLPLSLLAFAWGAYLDSVKLGTAAKLAQGAAAGDGKTLENLSNLMNLQQSIEHFECQGQTNKCRTSGRRFYWGLYPAQATLELARSVYLEKLKALFLDPLFTADMRLGQTYNGLKIQLDQIPVPGPADAAKPMTAEFDAGKAYSLLKAFLMFSTEAKADPRFLEEQTRDYWCQGVQDREKPQAMALLRFYLHQLGDHGNPAYRVARTRADDEAIDRIRKLLLVVEPDRYYYGMIQEEGKRKVDSITLAGVLAGKGTAIFDAGSVIDGTYTKIGWDTFAKDKIAEMKRDYEEERSWVLGTSAASPGELKIDEKLLTYYFRDYQQSWWNFLRDVQVKRFDNFQDASEKLALLADAQQSPLIALFKAVSVNTWDDLDKLDTGALPGVMRTLDGAGGMRMELSRNFQAIHSLVMKKENQDSALAQYLKSLSRLQVIIRTFLDANQPAGQIADVAREADGCLQATNGLLVNLDANARQTVEPLLKQPVQQVLAILNKATPVGAVKDVRERALTVGGGVKEKDKNLQGATVILLEAYSDNKFVANKEIMRTQTKDGTFQFPNQVNPGPFKICAAKKGETNYYCGDVRLERDSDGKPFELRRPRSVVVFGGGKLDLTLRVR